MRRSSAAGVLEILDPLGGAETIAHVQPAGLWRPAVIRVGKTVLLQGSQFLTDWARSGRAGVKRAMRAGLLTGGVVPVELDAARQRRPAGGRRRIARRPAVGRAGNEPGSQSTT